MREVRVCSLDGTPLESAQRDPLLGQVLDRYHIQSRLGIGGMGCVYRARHHVLERWYAIKVLFGDFSADEKFQARFRREAQSMSRVRHPNVISVEDFGTTPEGLTFLAMELIEGETLEDVIHRDAPLDTKRVAMLMRHIARGLQAAHERDLVHRDVKPSNVMVYEEEGKERIKLLDFGAVGLRAAPQETRLTSVGHIIGTPTYMAPEQTHDASVTPSADLYALGVVGYEMLTGAPPFEGERRAEVLVRHITEQPVALPNHAGLGPLIMRLLEKKPSMRPPGARELVQELDGLLVKLTEPTEILQRRPSAAIPATSTSLEMDTLLGNDGFAPLQHDDEVDDEEWQSWSPEVLTPSGIQDPAMQAGPNPQRPVSLLGNLGPSLGESAPKTERSVSAHGKLDGEQDEGTLTDPRQPPPGPALFEPERPNPEPPSQADDSETQVDYQHEPFEPFDSGDLAAAATPLGMAVPDQDSELQASATVLDPLSQVEVPAAPTEASSTEIDSAMEEPPFEFPASEIQVAADSIKYEFKDTLPAGNDHQGPAMLERDTPPTLSVQEADTNTALPDPVGAAQTLRTSVGALGDAPTADDVPAIAIRPVHSDTAEARPSTGRLFWAAIAVLSVVCFVLGWVLLERRGYIDLGGSDQVVESIPSQ